MAAFCIVAGLAWVFAFTAFALLAWSNPSHNAGLVLIFIFVLSAVTCAAEDRICAAADDQCRKCAP